MQDLSSLHQEISLLFKNLEKAVNDMKVQNRNVDLLHENINTLQHELAQKNEIIKSLMEIQSTLFDSLSVRRNNQLPQINKTPTSSTTTTATISGTVGAQSTNNV